MEILYLDCSMGAAGDMLTAALLELLSERGQEAFMDELNGLGLPGIIVKREPSIKCGIKGTHVSVYIDGTEEDAGDMHDHQDHHHYNEHKHDHEHSHLHTHEHEYGHEHEHSHVHEHTHGHGHAHEHEHPHRHTQPHPHEHIHEHEHQDNNAHHHNSLHEIEHIVCGLKLSEKVKSDVISIFSIIAEAESCVHGVPVNDIHFHEVGTLDAIADITAFCMLMEKIAPEKVVVSPVHVGSGKVKCAHGILPVPAPATTYILKNVPIYSSGIKGELCTPTGAAILKYFADEFGSMPLMKTEAIGYGMGKKDFEAANCVRAMIGESVDSSDSGISSCQGQDQGKGQVFELSCNLDDMTPESIGFAMERFFDAGAIEVYTIPIGMKKSRPGIMLSVMCNEQVKDLMVKLIFKHTTTLGIRESIYQRYTLNRKISTVGTQFGPIRQKLSDGYSVKRVKYEYDDLSRIAKEQGLSLADVIKLIENNGNPETK